MSDARTQAIHKAATELVQELLGASGENGGERWFHIIVRKMEQIPPLRVNSILPLRIGNYELSRLGGKVMVNRIFRDQGIQAGGDGVREVDSWEPKDIAKLKLWLNGE